MRHSRRMYRSNAVIAVSVVALGLPGVALAGVARQAAAKVTVTFTDTKFGVSVGSLQAGTATFVVVNQSHKLQVLAITGPGLRGVRTPKLAAGRSATLTVTLRTGAYMLSDPVGPGMSTVRWLVVNPAAVVTGNSRVVTPPNPLNVPHGMYCD